MDSPQSKKELSQLQCKQEAQPAALDNGGEEFSEQLYDEAAPTPPQFNQPHNISSTGGALVDSEEIETNARHQSCPTEQHEKN